MWCLTDFINSINVDVDGISAPYKSNLAICTQEVSEILAWTFCSMRSLHKLLTVIADLDRIEKMPLEPHWSVVRLVELGCLKMLKNFKKESEESYNYYANALVTRRGGMLPQIFWFNFSWGRFISLYRGSYTWVKFCWTCAAGLSETLPHYGLFCGQL